MITHTKKEILDILKKYPYLVSFLQKEKLFFKYINYSMNPKWENDYINKKYSPISIIANSFNFSYTKEGYKYWWDISSKYIKYLRLHDEI